MVRITRYGTLFSLLQEPSIIYGVIVLVLNAVGIVQKFLFHFIFGTSEPDKRFLNIETLLEIIYLRTLFTFEIADSTFNRKPSSESSNDCASFVERFYHNFFKKKKQLNTRRLKIFAGIRRTQNPFSGYIYFMCRVLAHVYLLTFCF